MTFISHDDLLKYKRNGSWRCLEKRAHAIIDGVNKRIGSGLSPKLGGGTRLMLDLDHRVSHDIDLFITNPQLIGYISPRLNDQVEDSVDGYEEAADFIKLRYHEGEIDFIVRGSLLNLPDETSEQTRFALEPIAEVLAKKLFYRGSRLTPRDLFDWLSIETIKPECIPQLDMAKLLKTKVEGINSMLDIMAASKPGRDQWESIVSPSSPDIRDAIDWARSRLEYYQSIIMENRNKIEKDAPEDNGPSL